MDANNKLLVVDDCPISRLIVRDMLRESGMTIVESSNGEDVISVIIQEKPDLILLDLHMPNKDGIDVLEELVEENYDIPIVVISSDATPYTKQTCRAMGIKDYLEKPFNAQLLWDTVNRYLQ